MGAGYSSSGGHAPGDPQRMVDYTCAKKPEIFFARLHLQCSGYTASPAGFRCAPGRSPSGTVSELGPVLVTGATGTVGSTLVRLLADKGVAVRAVSRRGSPGVASANGIESFSADLRDPEAVARALAGVERLFLATPLEEDMVAVAARVAEQACRAGVRQVVRLSAFGAGSDANTRLGQIHAQTEACLRRIGLPWVSLRPNAFMQNTVAHFADSIRRYASFRAPQGSGRVSVIDARDIAAVAAHILTQSPPINDCFELTGAQALSNYDIAAVLGRVLGRDIRYFDTEPGETRATLLARGLSPWLTDIVMELYDFSARDAAARVGSDVEELLGRAPTSFEAFARDYAGAFR